MKLTSQETYLSHLPSLRRYDLAAKLHAEPETIADMTDEQRRAYMSKEGGEPGDPGQGEGRGRHQADHRERS